MTQDEIIEMARRAGWSGIYSSWTSSTDRTSLTVPVTMQQIEAFANLVAAKEQKKWEDQIAVEIHEAVLEERERIRKAKECCILCEQKGVCNENTKDDEANTSKILGKS